MSISALVDFIGQTNLTDKFTDDELIKLGHDVCERFDQDLDSMKDWMDAVDFGEKLTKQELHPKSTPWPGASNFKSPILIEAAIAFGDRASLELLRSRNIVKADVIGLKTQGKSISRQAELLQQAKDDFEQQQQAAQPAPEQQAQQPQQPQQPGQQAPQQDPQVAQQLQQMQSQIAQEEQVIQQRRDAMREKQERSNRVTEAMNYQVNYEMKEWKSDQKRLLYTLPNVGTVFKKTLFDPLLGRNISHVIHYPDFVVNQATTSIDTARSFTHILDVSQNKVFENQQAGIWRDIDIYPQDQEGDEGSNELEEVTDASDNPNRFLEQYCFADLDDDGYEEPYIITVHEMSGKVVRIVARFDENSIMVINRENVVLNLFDIMRQQAVRDVELSRETGAPIPEEPSFTGLKLTRIEASQSITKYGFIPSQDGTFLDLGYFHLIGGITMAVNATTNHLLNAGNLANTQGGFLAKGFRKKMGPTKFKLGEWKSTDLSVNDLANGILPMPVKEPSQVLFTLNEKLGAEGRQFTAIVDSSGQIQSNTAPTTALAIIQEALVPMSALMGRIIDSMSNEFQILFKLNGKFFDPQLYQVILDDQQADFQADFNAEGMDIIPTANAEMSSKMQRIQLAEVQMAQIDNVLKVQGNPIPIVEAFFDAIGSQITDDVFPEEAQMSKADREQLEAVRAQQEQANQLQEQSNQIAQFQAKLFERAEDRKDREQTVKENESQANIEEKLSKIDEINANIILTLEKAESEDVKNQVAVYTAQLQALTRQSTPTVQ